MKPDTASSPGRPVIHDCWNKIGVRGDGSCPELARYTHCRNCPVYSAAAVELLDGELPPGYLAEWTTHFTREKAAVAQDTHSVVIFRIGAEWLALSTQVFKEVSELKTIHSLPHRRNQTVLGLVNIRGELLLCVSLEETLNLGKAPETQAKSNRVIRPYLLVIGHGGGRLAFPVAEVGGIHHFNLKEMKEAPATVAVALSTYTRGILPWREKTVGWLDDDLLVPSLNKGLS
jgi:chemotaxis-related protein WspD